MLTSGMGQNSLSLLIDVDVRGKSVGSLSLLVRRGFDNKINILLYGEYAQLFFAQSAQSFPAATMELHRCHLHFQNG